MIGGSIARALRKANPQQVILAVDLNQDALNQAVADGVINKSGVLDALCPDVDIVIISLPPLASSELLPRIASLVKGSAVVTDVASVKSHMLRAAAELGDDFLNRFVPAHPIAGSEKSGYEASIDDLFEGRNVILTPQAKVNSSALTSVNTLWRSLGANVLGMSAERHDEVLAATSHLPHLLAYSIVDVLLQQEQSEDIFRYAAGGFADFSRLASSDARMWSDIFVANAVATEKVLEDYIQNLISLKKAVVAQDHAHLMRVFSQAKQTRDNFINTHFKPSSQVEMTNKQINFQVEPGGQVSGRARVPGDKSISHRSIIFASIANGVSHVKGFLEGEDALNTLAAFREMGVTIVGPENGEVTIYGVGKHGLKAPRKPLYMGNSGTAMRLLAGLLAAQSFDSVLTGDESLSLRPMNRIAEPLRAMGASIDTGDGGRPPLRITGSRLKGISYDMPMASAQVKSCLLLAGLYADGRTEVSEPATCRDHTERMLSGFGYAVMKDSNRQGSSASRCSLDGQQELQANDIEVPADISSAAFFMVAAAICPGSTLVLEHVGVNPTRTGIINLLRAMGTEIELSNERIVGGEPVADITVRYQPLTGIEIPSDQIPLAIDEFPALFIAAACAEGETVLRNAAELRVKESDRIAAMAEGLQQLGIVTQTFDDGIRIEGGSLGGGTVDSHGDHRIAMAFTIAALRAESAITVLNCGNVATSFPNFVDLAQRTGIKLSVSKP